MKPETRHRKKMIAPILITVFLLLYLLFYFLFLVSVLQGAWRYLLVLVPVALAAVLVAVCAERIKEIRSGEEDDLGKY